MVNDIPTGAVHFRNSSLEVFSFKLSTESLKLKTLNQASERKDAKYYVSTSP